MVASVLVIAAGVSMTLVDAVLAAKVRQQILAARRDRPRRCVTNFPRAVLKLQAQKLGGQSAMDFIDHLRALATRISHIKGMIQPEEAPKNAMVMPFIQLIGYDVLNPLEVTPELIADVGTKNARRSTARSFATVRTGMSTS